MGKVKLWVRKKQVLLSAYQFPMGKVKLTTEQALRNKALGYQFPMGKVKLRGANYEKENIRYQFPMGKVKNTNLVLTNQHFTEYQFPMGKVKNNILCCVLKYTT